MRWRGERESDNVEDERGSDSGSGSGPGTMVVRGGLGTIVVAVVAVLLGADPGQVLRFLANNPAAAPAPAQPGQGPAAGPRPANPAEEERVQFVKVVLADTEDVWTELFQQHGKGEYRKPMLTLFSGQVRSGCGFADAEVGPFYCPADSKVYLDLSFFAQLSQRFKAPGDFAQAYVIAHEVGHHVQNLLGTSRRVSAQQQAGSREEANALSVRLELQADFYAGVWAHHAQKMKNILEPGDIESALTAATAIGDDTLQRQAQGRVVPDSFTHGTSAQRVHWFRKGFETGDVRQGDTFGANSL